MKKNEKGFSPILVIAILLVIVGVGFAAYRVISKNNKNEPGAQQPAASQEQSADKTTTTQPTTNEGFYEIKEWGIKIALRDYDKVQLDVKKQTGYIFDGDSYDEYADPYFKPAFLQDKECKPGVALFRSKAKFPSVSDDAQKKVGDHYYIVTGGPGPCSEDPENNPDDQLKTRFLKDFSDPNNITGI